MSSTADDLPVPDFEIDHRNEYAQYLLSDPQEISHYLKQLSNRGKLLSAHLDGGKQFFSRPWWPSMMTRVSSFDTAPPKPQSRGSHGEAGDADGQPGPDQIQFRLPGLREQSHEGRRALAAMPGALPACSAVSIFA